MVDGQRKHARAQEESGQHEVDADHQPGAPEHDWLDCVAADDEDERRRLLRELVMRALL